MSPHGLAAVAGLSVGHFTDTRRPTGCTVILAPQGAVAGVDALLAAADGNGRQIARVDFESRW